MISYPVILLLCTTVALHAETAITEPNLEIELTEKQPLELPEETTVSTEQMQLVLAPVQTERIIKKQQLEQDFARDLLPPDIAKKQYKEHKRTLAKKNPRQRESFWSSTTINDMNYQQLLQRKNELIVTGDYTTATKYLERMLKLAESTDQIVYIMLELAELFMQTNDYKKAEVLFRDFVRLYPGNEYAELAFVKAIECSWYQTLRFDRDQTKTEETLALIGEFNTRKDVYGKKAVNRVTEIKILCDQKLAQSSISIAKNDIGLSKYKEVHKRIEDLRLIEIAQLPNIEPQLLELEIELAQAEQNNELKDKKLSELKEKFPNHNITLALTAPKTSWFARA